MGDREFVAKGFLDPVDVPLRYGTDELDRKGVPPFAVYPTHDDLRAHRLGARESGREGARAPDPFPRFAFQGVQKVTDRFVEPFVGRLGEREPAPRADLPMVHPKETALGQRPERVRRRPQQAFDFDHLLLPKDRL